jgi:hypothetical protein
MARPSTPLPGSTRCWQGIDAVQAGRVYLSPTAPFGWIGRPPSLNRMMGLHWMAGLRYPDRWQGDLRKDIVGCSEPANRVT